jgi:hypothetical protein
VLDWSVGAFFLASGLHELIRDVSMVAHSFQHLSFLPPIGIGSMGVFFSTPPCCPPTGADWHRLCTFNQIKKRRFIMFLSGYVFAFVIGVAVGFVFSNIILFGNRLDQTP